MPVKEGAEHFPGHGRRKSGIAPSLQSHVVAKLKEEVEAERQRHENAKCGEVGRGGKNKQVNE